MNTAAVQIDGTWCIPTGVAYTGHQPFFFLITNARYGWVLDGFKISDGNWYVTIKTSSQPSGLFGGYFFYLNA